MKAVMLNKLHAYLRENNPDLLIRLQEEQNVTGWLEQQWTDVQALLNDLQARELPAYLLEETLLEALTRDLRPSRFLYLSQIIESEFEQDYRQWQQGGVLTYELLNLLAVCQSVLDHFGFSEDNEDDQWLRYAVIGTIQAYKEQSADENREVWLTMR